MTSVWTGERVRLRGIEPEDWPAFKEFDEHSADMRSADMLYPPRSDEGYRRWALEAASSRPHDDNFRLAIVAAHDETVVGTLNTIDPDRRQDVSATGSRSGTGISARDTRVKPS